MMTTIDLTRLSGLQRHGLACVACGAGGGSMTPLPTPGNPDSTHVFSHATSEGCVAALLGTVSATLDVALAMLDRVDASGGYAAVRAGGVR